MALIQEELKISKLGEILDRNLALPTYQRPYSWTIKSTNTLFNDTYEAFKNRIDEYRLGTVILHKKNDSQIYNIVDGQQRITTLSILIYCLGDTRQALLNAKYSTLSNDAIVTNFSVLFRRVKELTYEECKGYKEYLLNKCTIVQIVTNSEQEAFQFFDSQNSRGKELAPHDLLKSYHLREMNDEDESEKIKIINHWENMNQNDLQKLFKNYLYPLTRWYKGKDGLDYSSNKIDSFKGIKLENAYNYSIYHKASNLFIEQFNNSGNNELIGIKSLNQFQLNQPIIAGKRFFNYTFHYEQLLRKIQKQLNEFYYKNKVTINDSRDITINEFLPSKRSGDIYVKNLYECALLFFVDRFGINSLTDSVIKQLYSWSYSLRLTMELVYKETINKYSKGEHERVNYGINIFSLISDMAYPEELNLIVFEKPNINEKNKEKYKEVYKLIYSWNRW